MESHFLINKNEGETPLEALERLRREKNIDQSIPMTYAGRLDPMAEGMLLILVGDECKNKEKYLGFDKEYEVDVLIGIGSDTGDILGVIKPDDKGCVGIISDDLIQEKIKSLVGKRNEKYPAFSSRTVNGKPLFAHTREGESDKIEIPEKEIEIYSIIYVEQYQISQKELQDTVSERVSKVNGDFRQKEVLDSWRNLSENKSGIQKKFQIIRLIVNASSGSYMRTLSQKLGELFGTIALAWRIKRTKILEPKLF